MTWYHKAKLFPEYKGTDIMIVKCQGCGIEQERSVRNVRQTLSRGNKVLCLDCIHTTLDKNYDFLNKIYEVKKISKKHYKSAT